MAAKLTHVDESGKPGMVDVGDKAVSRRKASAEAILFVGSAVAKAIRENSVAKGPVFLTARLAGIMAAKKTGELIPLCHPLQIEQVEVNLELREDEVFIVSEVSLEAKTGVEMEALTAASVAALTVYDMCKAISKEMELSCLRLTAKSGGRSGDWSRDKV